MKRYTLDARILREREYYDVSEYADMFEFAHAQMENEDFNPENAVIGITAGSPNLYTFNLPAALVLEAISRGMGKEELIEEMTSLFEVDSATVSDDIDAICQTMEQTGIIACSAA